MIEFRHVFKTYSAKESSFEALKNVSFTVSTGSIFGVVGVSGSGKTTLLRCLNGLEQVTSGEILADGKSLNHLSRLEHRHFLQEMATIFQGYNLLSHLNVEENVKLPMKLRKQDNPLKLEEVLRFVGLEDLRNDYPRTLSGGEKQRVAIARALLQEPKILLCDEPTSALDWQTTQDVINLLQKVQEKFGTTILIVSHELDVIKQLCHEAIILVDGEVVEHIEVNKAEKQEFSNYHHHAKEYLIQ